MTQGPLTAADLALIWKSSVDRSYHEPIIRAGEGRGYEVYTQYFKQLERVATAIDVTTQAMFIRPHSGQTNESAKGGRKATVELTFARTLLLDRPLVLQEGMVFVEEETNDFSPDGTVPVRTGRRYTLTESMVFLPGDVGPFTVIAEAENIGWGFNNPLPGSLKVVSQLGTKFYHDRATVIVRDAVPVVPTAPSLSFQTFLSTVNEADTFIPEHVGQYMQFTGGANIGKIGRIITFTPPDASVPIGSTVQIEVLGTLDTATHAGTFLAGEVVTFDSGGPIQAFGTLVAERVVGGRKRVAFVITSGNPFAATTMTGLTSAATLTVEGAQYPGGAAETTYIAEAPFGGVGGAAWAVLDWEEDWGLSVTNVLSPSGGRHAMLDMLGDERNIPRTTGETDDNYSERVAEIADVVTPNAIRRTLNRTIGSYPWCFREVGSTSYPGIFYDRSDVASPALSTGDFYDSDVLLFTGVVASGVFQVDERVKLINATGDAKATGYFGRIDGGVTFTMIRKAGVGTFVAGDTIVGLHSGAIFTVAANVDVSVTVNAKRFHTYLGFSDFRGFFFIGVPKVGFGEFGFAYDVGTADAWDTGFMDGYPAGDADFYRRIFNAIDRVKAGGVGWQLYQELIGCP